MLTCTERQWGDETLGSAVKDRAVPINRAIQTCYSIFPTYLSSKQKK